MSWWVYGKFKTRQSRQLTAMASEYIRNNQIPEARMSLETALRLEPSNAEALRWMARLQTAQGSGSTSLQNWQKLAESGSLTLEDLTNYAVAAAREGEWTLAERLADAAARGGNPVLRHILRAELLSSKQDMTGAEAELRLAVEVDKSGNSKATLAKFLIANRLNGETAPEVRELLRALSARPDSIGAEALASAITTGLIPPSEIPAWITSLRAHPKATNQLLLLADLAEIQLTPQNKSALAKKTADRLASAPLPDRIAAMQTFLRIGEPALASSMVTPEEAVGKREILSIWLDANSIQNKWGLILETLDKPDLPLPSHLQKLYRARALTQLGRQDDGVKEFQDAYQESLENQENFLETLAYLALAGQTELFEQGVRANLSNPETAEQTVKALVPAVQRLRDSAKVRRVYELALTSPALAENLTVRNDFDYLSLLVGQPVNAREIALRSQANPRDFSFRVTNALALLRGGEGKQALAELENCEPDVHVATLAPHQKTVVAAALAAAGRRQEALQVASMVPPLAISAQEVQLLQTYLAPPKETPKPASKSPAKKKKSS